MTVKTEKQDPIPLCPQHRVFEEKLDFVFSVCKEIEKRLSSGDTIFATMNLRVKTLENVVYSGVALILVGVGTAILALVLGK